MKKMIGSIAMTLLILTAADVSAQDIPKWKISQLDSAIKKSEGPVVINFWATWCKPCVQELPHFLEVAKKYEDKGVRLLLVSLDMEEAYPAKLKTFIIKRKVSAPVFFLDETDADAFCPKVDPSWSGAIPASLFVNNNTGYRAFHEEEMSREALEKEIQQMLQKK